MYVKCYIIYLFNGCICMYIYMVAISVFNNYFHGILFQDTLVYFGDMIWFLFVC